MKSLTSLLSELNPPLAPGPCSKESCKQEEIKLCCKSCNGSARFGKPCLRATEQEGKFTYPTNTTPLERERIESRDSRPFRSDVKARGERQAGKFCF